VKIDEKQISREKLIFPPKKVRNRIFKFLARKNFFDPKKIFLVSEIWVTRTGELLVSSRLLYH
jgi:hypothetical protein